MKQNFLDLVTDELKKDIKMAMSEARGQFKDTRPYRQQRKQISENLTDFLNLTPERITELRSVYGDITVDRYLDSMKNLLRREGRNARR